MQISHEGLINTWHFMSGGTYNYMYGTQLDKDVKEKLTFINCKILFIFFSFDSSFRRDIDGHLLRSVLPRNNLHL